MFIVLRNLKDWGGTIHLKSWNSIEGVVLSFRTSLSYLHVTAWRCSCASFSFLAGLEYAAPDMYGLIPELDLSVIHPTGRQG